MMKHLLELNKKLEENQKTRPSSHYGRRLTSHPCSNDDYSRKIKTNHANIEKVWNQSASSLNRSKSPSFKLSKAQRFSDFSKDLLKNVQNLSLDLAGSFNKGCSFAKATRVDHFLNADKKHTPSPATYQKQRFLDNASQNSNKKKKCIQQEKCIEQAIKYINTNSQPNQTHYLNHALKKNKKTSHPKSSQKGRTFFKFDNLSKLYVHHGRSMPYKSQLFDTNPGVGTYRQQQSFENSIAKNRGKFSMGKILPRFNQIGQKNTPSPLTYKKQLRQQNEKMSFCIKQTFGKSKRTYLTNPDNGTPGPAYYK